MYVCLFTHFAISSLINAFLALEFSEDSYLKIGLLYLSSKLALNEIYFPANLIPGYLWNKRNNKV